MSVRVLGAIVAVSLGVAAAPARADQAVMLTSGNRLLTFDTFTPGTITRDVPITGLTGTETVKALDFRPATGQLYAFTLPTATAGDQIRTYTVDPATGAASLVGQTAGLVGVGDKVAGGSFDAAFDRFRYVDADDNQARIRPADGTAVSANPPAASGDFDLMPSPHAPDVVAYAIDRSFSGATLTTTVAIDRNGNRLDRTTEPPSFTVEVRVTGRRYVENRDTLVVVSGSRDDDTTFTERWRLVLGDDRENPWRLSAPGTAAPAPSPGSQPRP